MAYDILPLGREDFTIAGQRISFPQSDAAGERPHDAEIDCSEAFVHDPEARTALMQLIGREVLIQEGIYRNQGHRVTHSTPRIDEEEGRIKLPFHQGGDDLAPASMALERLEDNAPSTMAQLQEVLGRRPVLGQGR